MPSKIDGFGWFVREPEKSTVFRLQEVPADSPTVLDPVEGQPYPMWDGCQYVNAPYVKPETDPTEILFGGVKLVEPVIDPLAEAKAARASLVDALVVTTSTGRKFNGDEASQNRMARAISSMDEGDTVMWVLADNTVALIGCSELKEALRMAGSKMTQIWAAPYM